MNSEDSKVVREIFDTKIQALDKEIKARLDAQDKALVIQSKETERRLDILNHEAERLRVMQDTYLPREVFDKIDEARCRAIEAQQEEIKSLQSFKDVQTGKTLGMSAGVAAAIAAVITVLAQLVF